MKNLSTPATKFKLNKTIVTRFTKSTPARGNNYHTEPTQSSIECMLDPTHPLAVIFTL